MTTLRTLVDELAALLDGVNDADGRPLRVVTSPNDLNPPCAFIGAPGPITAGYALGGGMSLDATLTLVLMARGTTDREQTWIYGTLPQVMAACSATTADLVSYRLSDGRELPAYTITTQGSV